MSDISKLKSQIEGNNKKKPIEFKAILGRADGTVQAEDKETVYVTLFNGDVMTIFNENVPLVPYRKIIIGYDDSDESLLQVLRFDNVYSTRPQPNLPNHKNSHAWFSYDPIEVYAQQIMPLLPRAIGGMVVRVYGGDYYCNSVECALSSIDIDMTSEIPTSGAEWVNAEVDEFGAITFAHGANKPSREMLLPTDRPLRTASRKLLYSARMYVGMKRLVQNRISSDIFDPRFTGFSSGGQATSIDWTSILNIPAEFPPDLSVTDAVYPRKWYKSAAPTADDDITSGYAKSDIWIDQSSGDAYICIDNADGAADWLRVGSGSGDYSFAVDGRLAVAVNVPNAFIVTKDVEITACYIYCKTPGASGSTVVDVNKNGSTIYATQANRPTLAFDDPDGWASSVPDDCNFTAGDVITLDIDQTADGAEDLVVALSVKGAGSGSGGLGLVVTDGVTTASNVAQITIEGGKVIDSGGGQISIKNIRDYILVRDEKPSGTQGGAFPSGVWNTRTLTTISSDDGSHCSLATNQITLAAGTYEFEAIVPAMSIETHQAALYNVTDSIYYYGTSAMSRDVDTAVSSIDGKFSISSPKVFEIRDYSPNGNGNTYGMGHAAFSGQVEVYSVIKFWKVN